MKLVQATANEVLDLLGSDIRGNLGPLDRVLVQPFETRIQPDRYRRAACRQKRLRGWRFWIGMMPGTTECRCLRRTRSDRSRKHHYRRELRQAGRHRCRPCASACRCRRSHHGFPDVFRIGRNEIWKSPARAPRPARPHWHSRPAAAGRRCRYPRADRRAPTKWLPAARNSSTTRWVSSASLTQVR